MSDECSRCNGRGYHSDGFGRVGCLRCYGTGKADAKHPQTVFAEERDARIRAEARREALEEAAKVCDEYQYDDYMNDQRGTPEIVADLIRALAKEPKP